MQTRAREPQAAPLEKRPKLSLNGLRNFVQGVDRRWWLFQTSTILVALVIFTILIAIITLPQSFLPGIRDVVDDGYHCHHCSCYILAILSNYDIVCIASTSTPCWWWWLWCWWWWGWGWGWGCWWWRWWWWWWWWLIDCSLLILHYCWVYTAQPFFRSFGCSKSRSARSLGGMPW